MIYLASPYSHPDPAVRRRRYQGAMRAMAWCLRKGLVVYSPIVACHPLAVKYDLPRANDFWSEYNLEFLKRCDNMYILELPGWLDSVGIQWESGEAVDRALIISNMTPLHNGHYEITPQRAKGRR